VQSKQVDFLVAILSDSDGDGDYTNLVLSQPKLEGSYPEEEGKCQRLHSGGLYCTNCADTKSQATRKRQQKNLKNTRNWVITVIFVCESVRGKSPTI